MPVVWVTLNADLIYLWLSRLRFAPPGLEAGKKERELSAVGRKAVATSRLSIDSFCFLSISPKLSFFELEIPTLTA